MKLFKVVPSEAEILLKFLLSAKFATGAYFYIEISTKIRLSKIHYILRWRRLEAIINGFEPFLPIL